MPEAVIIDCLRTPVGKAPRGTLRNTRPDDLGAIVIRALLDRYPAAKDSVEDVIIGCAMLGRPGCWLPLWMNVIAGSWLMASVFIVLTMQSSSTIFAMPASANGRRTLLIRLRIP